MIYNCAKPLLMSAKLPLPVAVRRSKAPLLKFLDCNTAKVSNVELNSVAPNSKCYQKQPETNLQS